MSDKAELVQVIALHDLSYIDHERNPQYRRQSSLPFPMDKGNADHFLARKAVKLASAPDRKADPAPDPNKPVDEDFPDEFGEEAEANVVEDFGDEAEANPTPTRSNKVFGKLGKKR